MMIGKYLREKYNVDVVINVTKGNVDVIDLGTGDIKFTLSSKFFENGVTTEQLKTVIESELNK